MSSVLRAPSQIPVRSKFLIATANSARGNDDATSSAIALNADGMFESIMTAADVNTNFGAASFSAGALFRDLGRQVMIVDAAGAHVALFREAMPQATADAEGAALSGSVWLRVWAAAGDAVRVARLG